MVHVTSEANASPIITAFTIRSALRNIPQGERSGNACPEISTASGAGTAISVLGFGAAAGAEIAGARGSDAGCAQAAAGMLPSRQSTVQKSAATVRSLSNLHCVILRSYHGSRCRGRLAVAPSPPRFDENPHKISTLRAFSP